MRRVVFRHLHAVDIGQTTNSLGELEVFNVHQKTDGIACFAAAEALKDLLGGTDGKGRRLFFVKRTARHEIASALLEGHITADHINDVGTLKQTGDEALRNHENSTVKKMSRKSDLLIRSALSQLRCNKISHFIQR